MFVGIVIVWHVSDVRVVIVFYFYCKLLINYRTIITGTTFLYSTTHYRSCFLITTKCKEP